MSPKKNKVNLEIERKFLLKGVPDFGKRKCTFIKILQFYFEINGKRTRYRQSINKGGSEKYHSTKKKYISEGTNEELEFEITARTFHETFNKAKNKRIIEKTRYVHKYKGLKFEIDVYDYMNLVVMEVELKNINQKINFPDFIKKMIILEVTNFKEFGNFNLSTKY